jgi:hypothetical protein
MNFMNLSSQAILIIVIVFGGSFLLMIPIAIWNNKRKKQEADFISQNNQKAILHLYASNPLINGEKVKNMEHIRGTDLQYTVALSPGSYTISAKYSFSEPNMGKNVNYSTPKPIDSVIVLEAGHEYTLAIYSYSPEQRKNYYKGDVGEDVYHQVLDISNSGIGGYTKAYIICYKEK